jgi:osmotically-inducible protein OsmY
MKTPLLALSLLSLALVGCSQKDDSRTLADKTKDAATTAVDKTKEVATDVKNAVSDKLTEWKLTPSDIKADLEKGGRVVRSKAAVAGEKLGDVADNARIVTVINAKYVGESDLSALKINVDADKGTVTLKGTVTSPALIGKAILLALDTDGVHEVVSLLTVETK